MPPGTHCTAAAGHRQPHAWPGARGVEPRVSAPYGHVARGPAPPGQSSVLYFTTLRRHRQLEYTEQSELVTKQ